MRARVALARILLVSLAVPVCVALLYALVVPAFLGREEAAREALLQGTALVTGLVAVTLGALPLRYLPAVFRATRVISANAAATAPGSRGTLDDRLLARLYAAPREGALVVALFAVGLLGAAARWLTRDPDRAQSTAAVLGAAFAMTASLVLYPAMRRSLRPLFEALPPPLESASPALGDRLGVRVALAVGAPAGLAALVTAMLVSAHVAATARAEEDFNAKVFSVALGVRRMPGEGSDGREAAARVLAAGGARVRAGVELPVAEPDAVPLPSPLWALAVAVLFAGVGAVVGWRVGNRAGRELTHSTRRVLSVGIQQLSPAERSSPEGITFTFTHADLSLPEVRVIAAALDRVTETLAAMARDQRRAVTARAEAAKLRAFVLAGVSHDLRGPLNSVLGFAGLLLSGVDGDVTEGQRESLEALSRGGRDLLRLVDDLLDAARLDAGRMNLDRGRVLVGHLLDDARTAALERTHGLVPDDVRLPAEGDLALECVVDRARVAHHLGAVLAYALLRKGAAPATGASAPVTVRARAVDDDTLTLTVTARGTTPSREALAQLFDPFDSPPSGARAPAGLGLSMGVFRRVVELHGGAVWADVAPEGGLDVHVSLVRAPPATSSVDAPA